MLKSILLAATAFLIATPAAAAPVIGGAVVVSRSGDVIATYLGKDAAYTNKLMLGNKTIFSTATSKVGDIVNLGHFLTGTVLNFKLNVLTTGNTFYGSAAANSDHVAHLAVDYLPTGSHLGFEDIRGGGDRDYNDLIAFVSNTGATAAPEPATWALMIIGMGAVGVAMRRRSTMVLA